MPDNPLALLLAQAVNPQSPWMQPPQPTPDELNQIEQQNRILRGLPLFQGTPPRYHPPTLGPVRLDGVRQKAMYT
jgi:hypothetical protein